MHALRIRAATASLRGEPRKAEAAAPGRTTSSGGNAGAGGGSAGTGGRAPGEGGAPSSGGITGATGGASSTGGTVSVDGGASGGTASVDGGTTQADSGTHRMRLFVTHDKWDGDLMGAANGADAGGEVTSGLAGGDWLCQISARGAGLGGSWIAWLSDGHEAPSIA